MFYSSSQLAKSMPDWKPIDPERIRKSWRWYGDWPKWDDLVLQIKKIRRHMFVFNGTGCTFGNIYKEAQHERWQIGLYRNMYNLRNKNLHRIICSAEKVSAGKYVLHEEKLRCYFEIDIEEIRWTCKFSIGFVPAFRDGGPIAELDIQERFRWLTAVRKIRLSNFSSASRFLDWSGCYFW